MHRRVAASRPDGTRRSSHTRSARRHYDAGVLFQIWKVLERFRAAAGLATPLLVLAVLLRKSRRASILLAIAAVAMPFALASPVVANGLERCMQRSVRDTTNAEVQYDVAIVLSGSPEERLRPAADLLLSGRVRFLLHSGAPSAYESRVLTSTLRSRHIRDDKILF